MAAKASLEFGECKIEVEGPVDYVQDQIDHFLATVGDGAKKRPEAGKSAGKKANRSEKKKKASKKTKTLKLREGTYIAQAMKYAGDLHESGKRIFTEEDIAEAFQNTKDKPNVNALIHQLKYKKEWMKTVAHGRIALTKAGLRVLNLDPETEATKKDLKNTRKRKRKTKESKKQKRSKDKSKKSGPKPPQSGTYLEEGLEVVANLHQDQKWVANEDIKEALKDGDDEPNVTALLNQMKYKKGWLETAGRNRVRLTNKGRKVLEVMGSSS